MQVHEYQRLIDELQAVIDDAKALIIRAEVFYSEDAVPKDYDPTYEVYRWSVDMQRQYTLAMLKAEDA